MGKGKKARRSTATESAAPSAVAAVPPPLEDDSSSSDDDDSVVRRTPSHPQHQTATPPMIPRRSSASTIPPPQHSSEGALRAAGSGALQGNPPNANLPAEDSDVVKHCVSDDEKGDDENGLAAAASRGDGEPIIPVELVVQALHEIVVRDPEASQLREAAEQPPAGPLCFFGLHELGTGNVTVSMADAAEAGLSNFELTAAAWRERMSMLEDAHSSVVTFPCGHRACAACVAAELLRVVAGHEDDQQSTMVYCPECHGHGDTKEESSQPAAQLLTFTDVPKRSDLRQVSEYLMDHHQPAIAKADPSVKAAMTTLSRSAFRLAASRAGTSSPAFTPASATGGAAPSMLPPSDSGVAASIALCGICEDAPEVVVCEECGFGLCEACRVSVHSKGRYKRHTVRPAPTTTCAATASPNERMIHHPAPEPTASPEMCREHPTYPIELYCADCSVCICLRCHYSGNHRGHTTMPLADVRETLCQEVAAASSSLRHTATALEATLNAISEARATHAAEVTAMHDVVATTFGAARRLVVEAELEAEEAVCAWATVRDSALRSDAAAAQRDYLRASFAAAGAARMARRSGNDVLARLARNKDGIIRRAAAVAEGGSELGRQAFASVTPAMDETAVSAVGHNLAVALRTFAAENGPTSLRFLHRPLLDRHPAATSLDDNDVPQPAESTTPARPTVERVLTEHIHNVLHPEAASGGDRKPIVTCAASMDPRQSFAATLRRRREEAEAAEAAALAAAEAAAEQRRKQQQKQQEEQEAQQQQQQHEQQRKSRGGRTGQTTTSPVQAPPRDTIASMLEAMHAPSNAASHQQPSPRLPTNPPMLTAPDGGFGFATQDVAGFGATTTAAASTIGMQRRTTMMASTPAVDEDQVAAIAATQWGRPPPPPRRPPRAESDMEAPPPAPPSDPSRTSTSPAPPGAAPAFGPAAALQRARQRTALHAEQPPLDLVDEEPKKTKPRGGRPSPVAAGSGGTFKLRIGS